MKKFKINKKFFSFIILIYITLTFPRWYSITRVPIHLKRCEVNIPFNKNWQTDSKLTQEIKETLEKKFHYIGEGGQSYVFESEDGKCVLKLFHFYERPFTFMADISKIWKKIKRSRPSNLRPPHIKAPLTFDSCKIAKDLIPEHTGLIFTHLNPQKLEIQSIVLYDKLNQKIIIDPTKHRFVLQKKATPFFTALKNALPQQRDQIIKSLYKMIDEIEALGIANFDNSIKYNFGVIDQKAVTIDVGSFRMNPERAALQAMSERVKFKKEIEKRGLN
jgi:hypothetical protein